ncbi:MAG: hypothetical protein AAF628_10085 [Planctomycetota bacterium]
MVHKLTALLFSPILLTATAAAQAGVISEGPFAGASCVHSTALDDGSGLDPAEPWLKPTGFETDLPDTWSDPFGDADRPDFSKAALFATQCTNPAAAANVDIDALSAGLDLVLARPNGTVNVSGDSWGAIAFSLGADALGTRTSEGNAIRAEVATSGGASADVFTYILQGPSVPIEPELIDRTMRSQDSTEMGLPTDTELDALDLHMPVFRLDRPILNEVPPPGPNGRRMYFSVSTATQDAIPEEWWNGTLRSGATILVTSWNQLQEVWTCPRPFLTYNEIGLDLGDDLTALAVDEGRGYILFSSTRPGHDPFMFLDYGGGSTAPLPYTYDMGGGVRTCVSIKAGVQSTDPVDAICCLDPGDDEPPRGRHPNQYMFGTPLPRQLVLPAGFPNCFLYRLNGSAFRDVNTAGQPVLLTYGVGWPPSGQGGVAALWFVPFPAVVGYTRKLPPVHRGSPVEARFRLPRPGGGGVLGMRWFAFAPPFMPCATSAAFPLSFELL